MTVIVADSVTAELCHRQATSIATSSLYLRYVFYTLGTDPAVHGHISHCNNPESGVCVVRRIAPAASHVVSTTAAAANRFVSNLFNCSSSPVYTFVIFVFNLSPHCRHEAASRSVVSPHWVRSTSLQSMHN